MKKNITESIQKIEDAIVLEKDTKKKNLLKIVLERLRKIKKK